MARDDDFVPFEEPLGVPMSHEQLANAFTRITGSHHPQIAAALAAARAESYAAGRESVLAVVREQMAFVSSRAYMPKLTNASVVQLEAVMTTLRAVLAACGEAG